MNIDEKFNKLEVILIENGVINYLNGIPKELAVEMFFSNDSDINMKIVEGIKKKHILKLNVIVLKIKRNFTKLFKY